MHTKKAHCCVLTSPIERRSIGAQPRRSMGAWMARYNRTNDTTPPTLCVPDRITSHESGAHGAFLSRAEIAARSLAAATPGERRHWQVIGLLADRAPLAEIVAATGCRPRTIRRSPSATASRVPPRWRMGRSAAWEQHPCSRWTNRMSSARRSRGRCPKAGAGPARKSRAGSRPGRATVCIASGAGSICGGSAVLQRPRAPANIPLTRLMTTRIRLLDRPTTALQGRRRQGRRLDGVSSAPAEPAPNAGRRPISTRKHTKAPSRCTARHIDTLVASLYRASTAETDSRSYV